MKKVFLEISQNLQENTCARVSFSIKLFKKRLWHQCFPVNFVKSLTTIFLTEHLWWLLLGCFSFKLLTQFLFPRVALYKKWSFSLRISSVNVNKSTFAEGILNGKLHFLCSVGSKFAIIKKASVNATKG